MVVVYNNYLAVNFRSELFSLWIKVRVLRDSGLESRNQNVYFSPAHMLSNHYEEQCLWDQKSVCSFCKTSWKGIHKVSEIRCEKVLSQKKKYLP